MLIPAENLINAPVMSLQTGGELARIKTALIDPRNLTILAYELGGTLLDKKPSYLLIEDIREIGNLGFIVDSSDEFVDLDDIIKLKEVHDFGFRLEGVSVVDEHKHKLGKVSGYNIEAGSFVIQQLQVKRPLLQSLNDTELLVNRVQIVNVTNDIITVKDATAPPQAIEQTVRHYANPFRQTKPQTEQIDISES